MKTFRYAYLDVTLNEYETEPLDGREWETLNAEDEYYNVGDIYKDNARDVISDWEEHADKRYKYSYTDQDGERHVVLVKFKGVFENGEDITDEMEVGELIKWFFRTYPVSQKAFAERANIDRVQLSRFLNGKTKGKMHSTTEVKVRKAVSDYIFEQQS